MLPSSWNNNPLDANGNITAMRPNTLNVTRELQLCESKKFLSEALNACRERATDNYVPADKVQELFHELKFYPSEDQVLDMLQTAKLFARRSNGFDTTSIASTKQLNGLTFGEFCVLLADLKRFRTFSITKHDNSGTDEVPTNINNNRSSLISPTSSSSSLHKFHTKKHAGISKKLPIASSPSQQSTDITEQETAPTSTETAQPTTSPLPPPPSSSSIPSQSANTSTSTTTEEPTTGSPKNVAPEVFLGGSCNPTTWRADVAIPALNELGISFYNPQVSDWTPDLIELEHRAKEKARVLFFVMDSETRSSAGAIEAAHIAGQNARHLVLVLHPYKPEQKILNEAISSQEYVDLSRNQQLLRELVWRRGLPVLDSIPSGLQRTKSILAGNHPRDPPTNIASRLISVRRAFDRVVEESKDSISLIQCQKALSCLGYPSSVLTLENINRIVETYNTAATDHDVDVTTAGTVQLPTSASAPSSPTTNASAISENRVTFDNFCIAAAYLSVLQQEINNSACISPIKGFNVPPPPIFFTNMPEYTHGHSQPSPRCPNEDHHNIYLSRTNSRTSHLENLERSHGNIFDYYNKFSRDSGTSSPQPTNETTKTNLFIVDGQRQPHLPQQHPQHRSSSTRISVNNIEVIDNGEESDSTDSVFSSGSSDDLNMLDMTNNGCSNNEIRDIYLGGSCLLRTKWRQEFAIPYLKEHGVSYYLPHLHESIANKVFAYSNTNTTSDTSTLPHSEKRLKFNTNSENLDDVLAVPLSESQQVRHHHDRANNDDKVRMRRHQQFDDTSAGADLRDDEDFDGGVLIKNYNLHLSEEESPTFGEKSLFNPNLLDSSRVLFFLITNETRSLAPMTLAAHYIGLGYNIVLCVQMLPENCKIGIDSLTPSAIKDYNRGRAYLIDLAKRQGIPVHSDPQKALDCAIEKVKISKSRLSV